MARTFSAGCTTDWQPVVDGAQFSLAGIQLASQETVLVATATVPPDEDTKDRMTLFLGGAREVVFELEPNENLYIKAAVSIEEAINGYRKVRTA